jgi:hypothetical protein
VAVTPKHTTPAHQNRRYLPKALLVPLLLLSLVAWHAWFKHASLKCKANVKKGD